MPIRKAIGLAIAILVLKFLVPDILSAIERVALAFLGGAERSARVASDLAAHVGAVQISHEPFVLPQAAQVRSY